MPSDLGRHAASIGAGDERLSPGDQRCPPSARGLADAVSTRLIQTESSVANPRRVWQPRDQGAADPVGSELMPAGLVELADERHERVGVCGACAPDFSIAGAMPPSGASAAL